MTTLDRKVLIVTGASSGIGNAAVRLLTEAGAHVVATARRREKLEKLQDEIEDCGGSIVTVAGDVGDFALHERLVRTAVDKFGRLDGAFNNAGTLGVSSPISETALADWQTTITTNLTGPMLAAKAQVPQLQKHGGGSIVFTGSFVGYTAAFAGMAAYAASKAGLIGLSNVLAVECATSSIRVNTIISGGVDTPMGHESAPTLDAMTFVRNLHALKRIARPEEVAAAAKFLLSDDASFVTGTAMRVDGGVSIYKG